MSWTTILRDRGWIGHVGRRLRIVGQRANGGDLACGDVYGPSAERFQLDKSSSSNCCRGSIGSARLRDRSLVSRVLGGAGTGWFRTIFRGRLSRHAREQEAATIVVPSLSKGIKVAGCSTQPHRSPVGLRDEGVSIGLTVLQTDWRHSPTLGPVSRTGSTARGRCPPRSIGCHPPRLIPHDAV